MQKIIIFDTTLRDGEQAPGASLNPREKLEVSKQLESLGVDVIEAGFPVSSSGDFEGVSLIAKEIKKSIICALARAVKEDIRVASQALEKAYRSRIHVFLATSKIHRKYKLKKAKEEILQLTKEAIKYTRRFSDDIEFSPEDASRTEKDFLFKVIEEAIREGAHTINIPDTVGYAEPEEFGLLIKEIKENVPNIEKAVISVHCHNDLGLAVANSLSAIKNGARQVECTINGLGERAGNASLEEIVMALRVRKRIFGVYTSVNTKELFKTSRLVSKLTGFPVPPNKAIVGQNAFRHEAGIHQDGILKKSLTYEIIRPEEVGFKGIGIVLGKHSGRHAFSMRLKNLGFKLSPHELDEAFKRFKELADKKKQIFDEDLVAIVEEEIKKVPQVWRLVYLHVMSGTQLIPTATLRLIKDKKVFEEASSGDGPVDACYKAIDKITGIKGELIDYSLKAVTKGKDALGEVSLKLKIKDKDFSARAFSTDIIEASVKAYLNAINRFISSKR